MWPVTPHRPSTLSPRGAALWLVGTCVLFWWLRVWQTHGDRVELYANYDVLMYWLPLLREAAVQWRAGTAPLWNPYQALGTPLLATQQVAALYPLNALYLVLSPGKAWLFTSLLHQMIAALGMYFFCRTLRCTPGAALVGAAGYAFSAVLIEKFVDLPDELICLAWLPVMFACTEALLSSPGVGAILRLALVWALQVLGGDAETIARSALLLCAYVLVRSAGMLRTSPGVAVRAVGGSGVAAVLALALTACQWMPTRELVQHSVRALGTLSAAQQAGFVADPWLLFTNRVRGVPTLSVGSSLALVLALLGMWTWRRRGLAWFFSAAALALAIAAAGPATPLFEVLRSLPTGTWFRAPLRFLNLWPMCVAPLVAAGSDALFTGASGRHTHRLVGPASACAIAVLAVQGVLAARSHSVRIWLEAAFFGLVPLVFVVVTAQRVRHSGRANWYAALLAVAVLAGTPAALYQPDTLSAHRVAELYGRYAGVFSRVRAEAPARVLSLLPVADGRSWAKLGTYFEVPVLNDFEPLTLASFRTFAEALRGLRHEPATLQRVLDVYTGDTAPPRERYDATLLNLSGVRYVLADATTEPELHRWFGPAIELVPWQRSATVVVYENPAALGRAFFVGASKVRLAPDDCVQAIQQPGFDPLDVLLLEQRPTMTMPGQQVGAGSVRISQYAPSDVQLRVTASVAGFVVLTDALYPGWAAYVDGMQVPILRGDCFFRAVAVPAGTHAVRFVYAPPSFRLGLCITLAAAAVSTVAWMMWRGRRSGS
jgi:hypothetical protein